MPKANAVPNDIAFARLVGAHGGALARYVRFRIGNSVDAEDVLQETLIAVWLGFGRVRDPELLLAWLIQVARNRCRDYLRKQERRELPVEDDTLQLHAGRLGLRLHRETRKIDDILDALDSAPPASRDAARRFYLDGLSIAEIAAESRRPPGTVKRRLFLARQSVRAALGVPNAPPNIDTEKRQMTPHDATDTIADRPAFPPIRPAIRIVDLPDAPFAVDCRELRSWPIVPVVGDKASAAEYTLPGWRLDEITTLHARRAAQVHGVAGVEIEARVWKPDSGWERPGTVYARLTDDKAEFLAVHLPDAEATTIETFLDDNFAENWGMLNRAISDRGHITRNADGSFALSESAAPGTGIGFGVVGLQIGAATFTCLRVLESPADADFARNEEYCLNVAYLTHEGRTILVRRYCRPKFVALAQFPVLLDVSERIVLNGVVFQHWYDILTNLAIA